MLMFSLYIRLFATPWAVARQTLLSMGSLQARILEWVAISSSRGLPDPEIEPRSLTSPALQVDSLLLSHQGFPGMGLGNSKYEAMFTSCSKLRCDH